VLNTKQSTKQSTGGNDNQTMRNQLKQTTNTETEPYVSKTHPQQKLTQISIKLVVS